MPSEEIALRTKAVAALLPIAVKTDPDQASVPPLAMLLVREVHDVPFVDVMILPSVANATNKPRLDAQTTDTQDALTAAVRRTHVVPSADVMT